MNAPIARLFALVLVLFAALVAFTSRWSFFEAAALRDNPKNARALIEEQRVKRGVIRAADGTLLARSEPAGAGTYRRRYTEAAQLLPQVIGFSDIDLGLVGACGLIATYLLIAERGFKTATLASDSFSKLLAAGLTAVLALQVFVIVGGVTRVIPLTGVTLPFVSYGGSSIVANFVLLALLLLISDRARRPQGARGSRGLT